MIELQIETELVGYPRTVPVSFHQLEPYGLKLTGDMSDEQRRRAIARAVQRYAWDAYDEDSKIIGWSEQ